MTEQQLPIIHRGDSYFHLGVPRRVDETPYSAIHDLIGDLIVDLNAVKEAWTKLSQEYEDAELSSVLLLMRTIIKLTTIIRI